MHFAIEGAGIIELSKLENGDLAIQHTGTAKVATAVESLCAEPHAYWDKTYKRWIVRASAAHEFISSLDKIATRFYHCT